MKTTGVVIGSIIGCVLIFLATLAISFLITAGLVWLICWALPLIGITAIGGWTVAFSWKLVIIVAVVLAILKSIFKPHITVNKEN